MSVNEPSYLEVLFTYGIDTRARRIWLHGEMNQELEGMGRNTPESVVRAIQYLDRSSGQIQLWISTIGGDVDVMFGLYDAVRLCRNPVVTIGLGLVASAGVLVLVAGDKRYSTENTWLMSHSESGSDGCPTIYDQEDRSKWLRRAENRWAELMGERTKKTVSYWKTVHKTGPRELWLDAKGMVQYGIVDEVLTPEQLRELETQR
jgi:ATP-dependent Clp protease protease subunit